MDLKNRHCTKEIPDKDMSIVFYPGFLGCTACKNYDECLDRWNKKYGPKEVK